MESQSSILVDNLTQSIILLDEITKSIHESWKLFFLLHNLELIQIIQSIDWDFKSVFPSKKNIFKVFSMDIQDIKVVLLGQDPYHGLGQAMGLSFSVPKGVTIPPSLYNIYKEIKLEFPERNYDFSNGDLTRWFEEEKIFLLNSALTVECGSPGSHLKLWENFTDLIIEWIGSHNPNTVFLLLGTYAKNKNKFISNSKSRCVYGIHPSPLSANRGGFFSSGIFKAVEDLAGPINWSN
jgi:uracil-DNA glycosylase